MGRGRLRGGKGVWITSDGVGLNSGVSTSRRAVLWLLSSEMSMNSMIRGALVGELGLRWVAAWPAVDCSRWVEYWLGVCSSDVSMPGSTAVVLSSDMAVRVRLGARAVRPLVTMSHGRRTARASRWTATPSAVVAAEVYSLLERRSKTRWEARKHPGQQRGQREVSKRVAELEARRCGVHRGWTA